MEAKSSLIKQKYTLKVGVWACSGDEQLSEIRIGWSYGWSLSRGWNSHQDRWCFLRIIRGFGGKRSCTLFFVLIWSALELLQCQGV